MKVSQLKFLIKKKTEVAAFKYLCGKQFKGKKGRKIHFDKVEMADYFLPDSGASLEEIFVIFGMRTEMNDMPYNFGKKLFCKYECQDLLINKYILICPHLNQQTNKNI